MYISGISTGSTLSTMGDTLSPATPDTPPRFPTSDESFWLSLDTSFTWCFSEVRCWYGNLVHSGQLKSNIRKDYFLWNMPFFSPMAILWDKRLKKLISLLHTAVCDLVNFFLSWKSSDVEGQHFEYPTLKLISPLFATLSSAAYTSSNLLPSVSLLLYCYQIRLGVS
eukprot:snap_masked-scaffold_22-processed-gene-0.15-mRNA-1 protein AED:1.00 eAED:1.00 QI:0/0/0/0/1/1/3/0/166